MSIVSGDCGGIEFRYNDSNDQSYNFYICQDGSYELDLYTSDTNSQVLIAKTSSTEINYGLYQSDKIAVVASSSAIDLYINEQRVKSINDTAYSSGYIGLIAYDISNSTEVIYRNAKVWTI